MLKISAFTKRDVDIKSHEGHDHEWFYAPTYQNAKIITGLLEKERNLASSDCQHCKPSE